MENDHKNCLECGIAIRGRIDKKFCSDQCRNAYNNHRRRDSNNLVRNINNQLRKNRIILADLNPSGKARVNRKQLLDKGFSFQYHTQIYQTKTGRLYKYCYDQGYVEIDEQWVALVIPHDYVT